MKPTPGPWKADCPVSDGRDFYLESSNGAYIINGCGCCGSPWLGGDNPEADARLIVAACNAFLIAAEKLGTEPVEMAERMADGGLAEVFDSFDRLCRTGQVPAPGPHFRWYDEYYEVFNRARAALKLFKGEA